MCEPATLVLPPDLKKGEILYRRDDKGDLTTVVVQLPGTGELVQIEYDHGRVTCIERNAQGWDFLLPVEGLGGDGEQ